MQRFAHDTWLLALGEEMPGRVHIQGAVGAPLQHRGGRVNSAFFWFHGKASLLSASAEKKRWQGEEVETQSEFPSSVQTLSEKTVIAQEKVM
jgi:hypothetical protein